MEARCAKLSSALVSVGLILSGCDNGGYSPETGAALSGQTINLQGKTINKIGSIGFLTRTLAFSGAGESLSTEAYGYFQEFNSSLNTEQLAAIENIGNSWDSGCTILVENNSPEWVDFPTSNTIQVGEVLTITHPGGSWTELVPDGGYLGGYTSEENGLLNTALPSGSILDIPGGDFQPFPNVLLPAAEPMSNVRIGNTDDIYLLPDSQVTWKAGSDPRMRIQIDLDHYSFDAQENKEVEFDISCKTLDTGTFSFPQDIKALLAKYQFDVSRAFIKRTSLAYEIKEDSLLLISTTTQSIPW